MRYIILGIVMMILTSCSKEKVTIEEDNYLVFGYFYSFCVKNCAKIYMLTETGLYKDFGERYPRSEPDFRKLSDEKFTQVKALMLKVPDTLFKVDTQVFGCPNCVDQGELFIEVSENGKVQNWTIDKFKKNVPVYLHDFMDRVNEAIALINE